MRLNKFKRGGELGHMLALGDGMELVLVRMLVLEHGKVQDVERGRELALAHDMVQDHVGVF